MEPCFFDYFCTQCDAPYCERVSIMNLALDITEEGFCLNCLASQQGASPEALAGTLKDYVQSRDCFKTPWGSFQAKACPRLTENSCFCQDEDE